MIDENGNENENESGLANGSASMEVSGSLDPEMRRFVEAVLAAHSLPEASKAKLLAATVAEPFTWSWVAISLAEGVLAYIGGQVFSSLFGGRNPTLSEFMAQLVETLKKVVRIAIQENEVRSLVADLRDAEFTLMEYLNAPAGRDRLERSTELASSAFSQLSSLGLVGHRAFMVAVSFQIVVLEERRKVFGDVEIENVILRLNSALRTARKLHREWKKWHRTRYTIVSDSLGPNYPGGVVFFVLYDGVQVWSGAAQEHASRFMEENLKLTWRTDTYRKHVKPSRQVCKKWKEILEQKSGLLTGASSVP